MEKQDLDEFYHLLRELCVTDDIVQKEAVAGLVTHLTQPTGNYMGLLRFLSYYGERYILPSVVKMLLSSRHLLKFSRIVELGAGFGWLGRGVSRAFNQMVVIFVDKRQWVFTDIVADIETENGVRRVLDELKDGDLIVMSELLHCLNNPRDTLEPFSKWPMLVVEYWPVSEEYGESYRAQITRFGCKPVGSIRDVFPGAKMQFFNTSTHGVWLVLPMC